MLLKQGNDLRDAPATAEIVPDDGMERIAAVGARRCTLPHNLLDVINAVMHRRTGSDAARWLTLAQLLLVLLRPDNGAIEQSIDVAELQALAELQRGHGKRFAGAPKQLQCRAVELKFAVQLLAFGRAPDAQPTAGGADLNVAVAGLVEQALRPSFDGTGDRIPHIVDIDGSERIFRRQHVGDAV